MGGIGFVACGVAVLFFGSNFLPVKQFDTGDGVFYQFVMCNGIWLVGLIVNCIQGFPAFEPLAMLGGVLWAMGNMLAVPVINCIGLSLGLLIWGAANLITGWSSGYFGLFGIKRQASVDLPALNIAGFCVALLSMVLYLFVKSEVSNKHEKVPLNEESPYRKLHDPLSHKPSTTIRMPDEELAVEDHEEGSWTDKLTGVQKRVVGASLAVISGVFYGVNFNPPQYLMDHGHSSESLDYVFSHFTGIYLTSLAAIIIYAASKKNNPKLYPKIILPGFVSGIMWAIAQVCWFIANQELQFIVSFPIITTGPGLVGSLWGIFLFGEIRGTRNLMWISAAFMTTLVGVILISLSKLL